jgi:hypothetical protein
MGEHAAMKNKRQAFTGFTVFISLCTLTLAVTPTARAFDFRDLTSIGAAYATHLALHEIGHQVVAHDVGAINSKVKILTSQDGDFYPALSTYDSIPGESVLPYAAGGERMSGFAFDYALKSYREKPTTFNKALMFFTSADFLAYTVLSNYFHSDAEMHDPNIIRKELGCSKGVLLSLVLGKSLINAYRVFNPKADFAPEVWVDKNSAALLLRFPIN